MVFERIIVPSFRLFQFDHQNCQEFSAKIGNFECIKSNMMTFSLRCLEFGFSYLSINQVFPIISLEFCISLFLTVDMYYYLGRIHLLLMEGPSIKCVLCKTLILFHQNLMKLGEVVVHMEYYNNTKFYQILMKNQNVLYITHLVTDGPAVKGR